MHVKGGSDVLLAAAMLVSAALSPMRASGDDTFDRSADGQVKNIIKAIADSDRRFEKALDGKLKSSVARGPNDEMDVKKYLGDLRQDINVVAQRFTDKYAASARQVVVVGDRIDGLLRDAAVPESVRSVWGRRISSSTSSPMRSEYLAPQCWHRLLPLRDDTLRNLQINQERGHQ